MKPRIWRSLLLGLAITVGGSGPISAQPLFSPDALARAIEHSEEPSPFSSRPSQSDQAPQVDRPNWPTRHPILTGAVIGFGAGVIVGVASCSDCGPGAALLGPFGVPVGAWTGLVASRVRKAHLTYDASGAPGAPEAMAIVAKYGVGESVRVESTKSGSITGKIRDIGRDGFSIAADGAQTPIEIAYSDLRTLRAKPLSVAGKVALGAGAFWTFMFAMLPIALASA